MHFIDLLAARRQRITGAVSSSEASTERLVHHDIPVLDLNDTGALPLYVDGADESNPRLELIKGGGGALTREKIIAGASEVFVCIADRSKLVDTLGTFPLPVEVIPMARALVARRLAERGARAEWREGFVTDNGNHILDAHGLTITDPKTLESELSGLPGVVTVGLFAHRPADVLILGGPEGVEERRAPE
jgi:ribose 5-phosphate isomerase A